MVKKKKGIGELVFNVHHKGNAQLLDCLWNDLQSIGKVGKAPVD